MSIENTRDTFNLSPSSGYSYRSSVAAGALYLLSSNNTYIHSTAAERSWLVKFYIFRRRRPAGKRQQINSTYSIHQLALQCVILYSTIHFYVSLRRLSCCVHMYVWIGLLDIHPSVSRSRIYIPHRNMMATNTYRYSAYVRS
jgi:hypothetical protein